MSDITDISFKQNEFVTLRSDGQNKKAILIKLIDELNNRVG